MVIVFDLDDTLYPEITFVYGGLRAVARYLSPLLQVEEEQIFLGLQHEIKEQRSQVFDRFLDKIGKKSKRLVTTCVNIYRYHEPHISLYSEAEVCLERFKEFPLYIVTDGNKLVQKRKFLALGLDHRVRRCFCTYHYGLHYSKPSPYCFQKICQLEQVSPHQVVYIADNPNKDFVGLKPLGFHTIRVLTGPYKDLKVDPSYEAELKIENLNQLDQALINLGLLT